MQANKFILALTIVPLVLIIPVASAMGQATLTAAEANEILTSTKSATLKACDAMPDFLVTELVKRSIAYGKDSEWIAQDSLTLGVKYEEKGFETYRVLAINGRPVADSPQTGQSYGDQVRGASSQGDYVSALANIFNDFSATGFHLAGSQFIRGRESIVFEYSIGVIFSALKLKADTNSAIQVGSRGRIWIDRERHRVLRLERVATDIPKDYPIQSASSVIDYEWITINQEPYLLPSRALVLMTTLSGRGEISRTRNDVVFQGYRKFGAELQIKEIP